MKSTKKALFLAIVSTLLCVVMLAGTTFAWFTDTVESGKNKIVSGNLDVALYYATELKGDDTVWTKVDGDTKIFSETAEFEPGYTEVVYLKVVNEGSLALQYQIVTTVPTEKKGVNVLGEEFALSDYLQFVSFYYNDTDKNGHEEWFTTRDGLQLVATGENALTRELVTEYAADATKNDIKNYFISGFDNVSLSPFFPVTNKPTQKILSAQYKYDIYAVALTMPTTVGNEANHNGTDTPEIELGVIVNAAQYTTEKDSFGNDYDADALRTEVADDLPPLEKLFEALSNDGGVVPEEVAVLAPTAISTVVDEDGYTYSAELDGVKTAINLKSTLTAANITDFGAIRVQGQSGRFSDVTFKGDENGVFTGVGSDSALVYCESDFNLTFESGKFVTDCQIVTLNFMGSGSNQNIYVKGGTFVFDGADKDNQASFVAANLSKLGFVAYGGPHDHTVIEVSGGTFYNCDPSAYVVSGYHVENNTVGNDIIYTVVAD